MECPIDGTDLVMSDRQGVEIDYCPKCRGVWLDRGELDKILERASGATGGRLDTDVLPRDFGSMVADGRKTKRDEYLDDDVFERDTRDDRDVRDTRHPRRRKSFLSDIFDIFD